MLLSSGPDYFILVDVLVNLRQPLDQAGETILTPDEAAQIRACGVEARAGQWRCPRLPKSVVGTLWALSHLAEDDEPATRPVPWREKRAAIRHVSIDPLGKADRQFLGRLRLRPLAKRWLQQTISRDCPARMFNHMRKQFARQDYLVLHKGLYSLTPKGAAAIEFEDIYLRSTFRAQGWVEFFGIGGASIGKTGGTFLYRKYSIRARLGFTEQPAYRVALVSIALLTRVYPPHASDSFVIPCAGLEGALLEAVRRLADLPENAGLCRRVRIR
jgi:hypothetical protein